MKSNNNHNISLTPKQNDRTNICQNQSTQKNAAKILI